MVWWWSAGQGFTGASGAPGRSLTSVAAEVGQDGAEGRCAGTAASGRYLVVDIGRMLFAATPALAPARSCFRCARSAPRWNPTRTR